MADTSSSRPARRQYASARWDRDLARRCARRKYASVARDRNLGHRVIELATASTSPETANPTDYGLAKCANLSVWISVNVVMEGKVLGVDCGGSETRWMNSPGRGRYIRMLLQQLELKDKDSILEQRWMVHISSIWKGLSQDCEIAQDVGDDDRVNALRAAALQALSAMIWFMEELSHISSEFDNVVQVVLENYKPRKMQNDDQGTNDADNQSTQNIQETEHHAFPFVLSSALSWESIVNAKGGVNLPVEDAKDPKFSFKVSVHNMAALSREATTFCRILESLFRYFGNNNSWSSQNGLQLLVENSGAPSVL